MTLEKVIYSVLKGKGDWKKSPFTMSGTFIAPKTGVYFINGCGGGAGGGYWASNSYSGGAGAACEMVPVFLNKGDSVSVTIGSGGVGSTGTTLASGGTTSFGNYVVLPGGQGSANSWSKGGLKHPYGSPTGETSNAQSLGGGMIAGASGGGASLQAGGGKFPCGTSSGTIWGGAGGWYGVGGNASTSGKGGNAAANTGAGGGCTSASGAAGGDGGSGYLEVLYQE